MTGQLPLRLIVLLAVAHASFAGSRLAITLTAVHLKASALEVGVIMSLLMAVPMFVSVPVGRWADRAGFRVPTLLGLAMIAGAGVLAAAFPSLAMLGAASLLVGSGYMLAHVAVNNAIGHAAGLGERTRAFGIMALGFSVSGLSGPMVAGFAIDHAGYRAAFMILATLPLVSAVLMFWRAAPVPEPAAPEVPAARGSVIDLLRDPALRSTMVMSGLVSIGFDLFTFIMPLHGTRHGLSASSIGLVAGAYGAGSFAVRTIIPWLLRSVDEWRLLRNAVLLTALCYFAFSFTTSFATMLPVAFVLGTVLGVGQPVVMSLVHLTAPPHRTGEAVGLRSMITSASQTTMPLLFGAVGAAVGTAAVFWAIGVVLVGGIAFARRRPHHSSHP